MYEFRPSQEERILALLRKGPVTSLQLTSAPLFIQQYNARIWGLRKKGNKIKCTLKYTKQGVRYGEYTLYEE